MATSWGPLGSKLRSLGPLELPLLLGFSSPLLPSFLQLSSWQDRQDCAQKWQQVISRWAQSEVCQCGLNPQQGEAGPVTGNLPRIPAAAPPRCWRQGKRDHPHSPRKTGWEWLGTPRKTFFPSLPVSSLTLSRPPPAMQVLPLS